MHSRNPSVLFFTLKIFSATGGIEKVCRVAGKALYEIFGNNLQVYCMHDKPNDAANNPYFPTKIFRAFAGSKIAASAKAISNGRKKNIVILSHINLLPVGYFIKKINPKVKLVLFTHGIEVWQPMVPRKKKMLQSCNSIFSVSNFTRQKMIELQHVDANKCFTLNNCLDPFLPNKDFTQKPDGLLEKYGIAQSEMVLMTLTRLAETERHKNYDKVIAAIASLHKKNYKNLVYLIAGKYTEDEKQFILQLADANKVKVILTGFIEDKDLPEYFALADMYIMPSKKEGFGITFIEAMYYGLPVIAGNADGSADALDNGNLGILVNPDSVEEIEQAIEKILQHKTQYIPAKDILMDKFGFEPYKKKLQTLLAG